MTTAHQPRLSIPPQSAFAGFRFPTDVIVVAVRWYLRFGHARLAALGEHARQLRDHRGALARRARQDARVRDLGVTDLRRPRGRRPYPGLGGGPVRRPGTDRSPAGRPLRRNGYGRLTAGCLGLHRHLRNGGTKPEWRNKAAGTSSGSADRTNRRDGVPAGLGAGGGRELSRAYR
jgi:hypothetical protein